MGDAAYIQWLNAVLADNKVFPNKERFEHLTTLRDETRGLMELVWGDDGAAFDGSDLTRFHRLLLKTPSPEPSGAFTTCGSSESISGFTSWTRSARRSAFPAAASAAARSRSGILQSLAERGFLEKFDYLSTVSGGGYIGGWLTAWIHRHRDGLRGVVRDLDCAARAPKLEPEPETLRHLREYSNFITPQTGILSADAWTSSSSTSATCC